ncbi:MAG: hypothetical protein ACI8R4_002487 [Paracoccaceae bacterium]
MSEAYISAPSNYATPAGAQWRNSFLGKPLIMPLRAFFALSSLWLLVSAFAAAFGQPGNAATLF